MSIRATIAALVGAFTLPLALHAQDKLDRTALPIAEPKPITTLDARDAKAPVSAPNVEKMAAGGLKYNRFHTTALDSDLPALRIGSVAMFWVIERTAAIW